ncbi:hypothetical protein [Prevotella dentasini]|uniref:hypothetical protein n=1 Tax=Prevotella dentasini TaxID=589537 RepID=UPI0004692D2F|nr:hypothetical protein [Prevotella dentasini]
MTKECTLKTIKATCYMALAVLAGWAVLITLQLLRWSEIISFDFGGGAFICALRWNIEQGVRTIQWIELVGYLLSSVAMIIFLLVLVSSCLRNLMVEQIFSRTNVCYLWGLTFSDFFFNLFSSNIGILFGVREISFGSGMVISPLIFLVITLLYQVAVYVSEENNLTI